MHSWLQQPRSGSPTCQQWAPKLAPHLPPLHVESRMDAMQTCGPSGRCPTSPRLSVDLPLALLDFGGSRTSQHTHTAKIIPPWEGVMAWRASHSRREWQLPAVPCLPVLQVLQVCCECRAKRSEHSTQHTTTAARMDGNPLGLCSSARSSAPTSTSPISHILALDPAGHAPHRGPLLPSCCSFPFFPFRLQTPPSLLLCCCAPRNHNRIL